MPSKSTIVAALDAFIRQRPGLEFGNYGDVSSYRAEVRSIGKDLQHARALLRYVEWHDSITAQMILDAAQSGRLSIVVDGNKVRVDYCTGQYWPTEYRSAVCRLLSTVIWRWFGDNARSADVAKMPQYGCMAGIVNQGAYIRKTASRELGTSIARRWFA